MFEENRVLSKKRRALMVRFFQWLIKIYSYLISPFLGASCRYQPTCSCYMHDALERHGFLKGVFLGCMRICRCHPYSKRNFLDPVPKQFAWRDILRYKRQCHREIDEEITEQEKLNES